MTARDPDLGTNLGMRAVDHRDPAGAAKVWQLRLPHEEDAVVKRLADAQSISKNDVVRRALRLLAAVERAQEQGDRVLVERGDGPDKKAAVEIWLI